MSLLGLRGSLITQAWRLSRAQYADMYNWLDIVLGRIGELVYQRSYYFVGDSVSWKGAILYVSEEFQWET